ncbi:MAG: hypothetical protein II359_06030 [Clostridia bacterium]|nr:hypothetical protein [Clostridia bacterium]
MDILKMLQESGKDLYPEDLDFFETELATGGDYDDNYQKQCRSLIKQLRAWHKGDSSKPEEEKDTDKENEKPVEVTVEWTELVPKGVDAGIPEMSAEELLFHTVLQMRESTDYKSKFKKYIAGQSMVDEAWLEKHYSFFADWEINAIVSVKPLSEPFLEKYFGAIDHDKIARYQCFSEAFFMKHFAQLDPTIVLQHGKNEWRKKEKRSKQLDVFLRLKGVKI